jgi:hypothetical protein
MVKSQIVSANYKKRDPDKNPVPFKIQYPMKNHDEDNGKTETFITSFLKFFKKQFLFARKIKTV